MHASPLFSRDANFSPCTASWTSASSRTTAADLPPNSRLTRLSCSPAMDAILRLTRVEPVNATLSTSGCDTRYSLVSRSAGRTLITPSGRPTRSSSSARSPMLSEFSGDTLRTTVFPASSAGMTLARAAENGEFHGMTAATTPMGSRRTTLRVGSRGQAKRQRLLPAELLGRLEIGARLTAEPRLPGQREPARRTVLRGDERGDLLGVGRAQRVEPPDDGDAIRGRGTGPGSLVEGGAGGGHGPVDVGGAGLRGAADHRAVVGRADVEEFGATRRGPRTRDEESVVGDHVLSPWRRRVTVSAICHINVALE